MDTTMTSTDPGQAHPTSRPLDPPIRIRVDGPCVVITTGSLDHDATAALAETINVTIATGSIAVLDLYDDPEALGIEKPACRVGSRRPPAPGPYAVAAGLGLLEVPTASQPWMIDVSLHRLCRIPGGTDRFFLPTSAWVGVRAISISSLDVVAITTNGDHIATHRPLGVAS